MMRPTSGYTRLLQKLGRAGRLVSMGENKVNKTISYTVQYGGGKQLIITIPQTDFFTKNYLTWLERKGSIAGR